MPRIGFVLTATAVVISSALGGCSALLFDRLAQTPSPPSTQTLQFESVPAGAEVHTVRGQTCQTPCSLALPLESQSVTFAKNGFLPQTVQITVDQPPEEHSFFAKKPAPTLTPNPVKAALLVAPPLISVVPQTAPSSLGRPVPQPRETIPWFPS